MEQRALGRLTVSAVGLGCNNFGVRLDEAATATVVRAALDAGVTLFDTADIYGDGLSEKYLGKALGADRDRVVLATKFGLEGGSSDDHGRPEYVRSALENSLRRLGTDVVDLYQQHRPDPTTPLDDTMAALEELVAEGKVVAVGGSNYAAEDVDAAAASSPSFVSVQNRYSVMHREPEQTGVVEGCRRHGFGVLPYFPLESGLLSGKWTSKQGASGRLDEPRNRARFLGDEQLATAGALETFAADQGRTLLELAVSWLACQPVVASVIAGATRADQVEANVAAATWKLSAGELAAVDAIVHG